MRGQSLKLCLMGRWGEFITPTFDLKTLNKWAILNWQLKELWLFLLGGPLIVFDFEDS